MRSTPRQAACQQELEQPAFVAQLSILSVLGYLEGGAAFGLTGRVTNKQVFVRADMTWQCVDALELIDELQAKCDTREEEDAIGTAKTLWQAGEQAQAFELLLSTLEQATTKLALQLPTLERMRGKVTRAGHHIEQIEMRLAALEDRAKKQDKAIRVIEQERDQAKLAKGKLEQKILLEQIAYTMSDLLENFVFGPAGSGSLVPLSVSDYAQNTAPMTTEQQARWSSVQAFFEKHMPVQDLLAADKYLRWLRSEPAHGKAQLKDTTFAQLHSWAGVHCKSKAVSPVQQYLRVLNQFSSVSKPLTPNIPMGAKVKQQ